MSYPYQNPYQAPSFGAMPAILAEEDARAAFIRRTYAHLFGAILLFVAFEAAVFTLVPMATLDGLMRQLFASRFGWLVVLFGFMGISWLANTWAMSDASRGMQYAGLGLYVVAEGVIFVPLLYVANSVAPMAIPAAGVLTLVMFGGLTALVFVTKSDLTSWGKYLWLAGLGAIGVAICAALFNFQLGVWFSARWWFWPRVISCTTRPTFCTGIAPSSMSPPRWPCLLRWPCCSGTFCGS